MDAELAHIAEAAVNVVIGAVVQVHRVQRSVAAAAREAALVPTLALADHHLGRVHGKATARTRLTVVPRLLANFRHNCTAWRRFKVII